MNTELELFSVDNETVKRLTNWNNKCLNDKQLDELEVGTLVKVHSFYGDKGTGPRFYLNPSDKQKSMDMQELKHGSNLLYLGQSPKFKIWKRFFSLDIHKTVWIRQKQGASFVRGIQNENSP